MKGVDGGEKGLLDILKEAEVAVIDKRRKSMEYKWGAAFGLNNFPAILVLTDNWTNKQSVLGIINSKNDPGKAIAEQKAETYIDNMVNLFIPALKNVIDASQIVSKIEASLQEWRLKITPVAQTNNLTLDFSESKTSTPNGAWKAGNYVNYFVTFKNVAGESTSLISETYQISDKALPILKNIPIDPNRLTTQRIITRRFTAPDSKIISENRLEPSINDNITTTWVDTNLN